MAPKKVVANSEQTENPQAKSGGDTKSERVIAVSAAEGYTGSALLELLASDQFKDGYAKLVGLTFGEPKEDTKAILEETGVETMMVDKVDENKLKELGVDTLCLIPPASKVGWHYFQRLAV